jgi:hypothetical protein
MIERSDDAVCGLYRAQGDEDHEFFSFSLKTKVDDFSQFDVKTGGYGSCGLASKSLTRVSQFVSQKWQL